MLAVTGMALAGMSAGCAARYDGMLKMPVTHAGCRAPLVAGAGIVAPIGWTAPAGADERFALDNWCDTTGPPVIAAAPLAPPSASSELVIVSWNLHVGAADVAELVRRLRSGALTGGVPATRFVLLLQEAHRGDAVVPRALARGARVPRAILARAVGRGRLDVVRFARSAGLAFYYVPSMRNGSPAETDEDRGNAILSTEPLSEFAAIELPFERQRRVAIAAVVSGQGPQGDTWRLRVVSAHLDSLASARRLWIAGPGARARQARGLLEGLHGADPAEPIVVGGDLNTWLGFSDPAYRAIARAIPDAARGDRRPTFRGLFRLDHLFARLPRGWTVGGGRLDDRLGSDHHPLLARVRITS
jgi:endonuclease/exonuclease/phosphatase family metal-dependent hydrolase